MAEERDARVVQGLNSKARNVIHVSHIGGRNATTWAITVAFQSLCWQESGVRSGARF